MNVVVYTKPHCVGCTYTKKFLDENEIPYEEVDIMSDPVMANRLRESGQLEMPHVVTDSDSWSGYRRDKLKALIQ